MHITQQKLLELAQTQNLAQIPLRKIGTMIGLGPENARLVQHHIDQLVKKGFIWIDRPAKQMKLLTGDKMPDLLRIPILGAASCGPANERADDPAEPEGYLSISDKLLGLKRNHSQFYFAVRAVGNSMNRAKVRAFGGTLFGIDDGDLVIIEKTIPDIKSRPYVLAIIDGLANIKRLVVGDGVVKLESESSSDHPTIYIDPSEHNEFVAGKVVGVIKK